MVPSPLRRDEADPRGVTLVDEEIEGQRSRTAPDARVSPSAPGRSVGTKKQPYRRLLHWFISQPVPGQPRGRGASWHYWRQTFPRGASSLRVEYTHAGRDESAGITFALRTTHNWARGVIGKLRVEIVQHGKHQRATEAASETLAPPAPP